MILRALGEEEANRVYPQMEGKNFTRLSDDVTRDIEFYCMELIRYKKYTTEKEILNQLKLYFVGQKKYKEIQIKRVIGEMLQKYNLGRKKVNKDLREKYNVSDNIKGYIIYELE